MYIVPFDKYTIITQKPKQQVIAELRSITYENSSFMQVQGSSGEKFKGTFVNDTF